MADVASPFAGKEHVEKARIAVDKERCSGCHVCELICSFHHAQAFSHDLSSIQVLVNNRTGEIQWSVDSSCDLCKGEEKPLCVRYCPYHSLKLKGVVTNDN